MYGKTTRLTSVIFINRTLAHSNEGCRRLVEVRADKNKGTYEYVHPKLVRFFFCVWRKHRSAARKVYSLIYIQSNLVGWSLLG